MKKALVVAAFLLFASVAHSTIIFQDNFDSCTSNCNSGTTSPPNSSGWYSWTQGNSTNYGGTSHYAGEISSPGYGGTGKSFKMWKAGNLFANYEGGLLWNYGSSTAYSHFFVSYRIKIPTAFTYDWNAEPTGYKLWRILTTGGSGEIYLNSLYGGGWYIQGGSGWTQILGTGQAAAWLHDGNWHFVEWEFDISANTIRLWIDDVLRFETTSWSHTATGNLAWMNHFAIGNTQDHVGHWQTNWQAEEFDDFTISTTAIGSGGGGGEGDISPPYASQWSPSKSSTGVSTTNRTINFHIQDGVDVLTANGVVNIEGANYTCSAGLTCTGNGTPDVFVTYVKGSDWSYSQTVNISTSGFRDTAGNIMSTDTWSFVTEDTPPTPLNITTASPLTTRTEGTPFTQTFTAEGGTEPYTWSVLSGTKPPGTALSPAGVFSGTPTLQGNYNFTAQVVDSGTVQIPKSTHWNYPGSIAITGGGTGAWDKGIIGNYGGAIVKLGNTYFYYYIGGSQWTVGSPAEELGYSKVGLATSTDGINWAKYAGNPIITYSTGDYEHEGIFSIAATVVSGVVHLYYGAMHHTGTPNPNSIDGHIRYRKSTDGYSFTDDTFIYSNAPDEHYPVGVTYKDSVWHLYTLGDAYIGAGPLNHMYGSTPTNVSNYTQVSAGPWRGGGDITWVDDNTILMHLTPGASGSTIETRTISKTDYYALSSIIESWQWGATVHGQTAVYYDSSLQKWIMIQYDNTEGDDAAVHRVYTTTSGTSDNQAFAITVNPPSPATTTKIIPTDQGLMEDTWIGGNDINYSTGTFIEVYQWPAYTWANRILDNIVMGLPDNVSISSAYLYMYMESWEVSGGTNPMRIYAYRVSDNVPVISTVTGNNFTGTLQVAESYTDVPLNPGWYSWNVTAMAQWAYANSSPLYIALDGRQDGSADTNRVFTSREGTASLRPYLSITYTQLTGEGGPSISAPGKMRVSKMKGTFR